MQGAICGKAAGSAEDLYEERENVPELLIKEELFRDVDKTVRSFLIHALLCELAGRRKDIEQVHVRLIEDLMELQTGRKIMLPYKMTAEKCYDGIWLDRSDLKTGEKRTPAMNRECICGCLNKRRKQAHFLKKPTRNGLTMI